MNHLRYATFCSTVTTAIVLVVSVGNAGEPIIIPGEKQKTPPPTVDKKLPSRDVFRFGDRLSAPSAFDVLTVPVVPNIAPLDPKEQKRRKLERLERENWMVVGKGELQAEEEEKHFWNVRDHSLEGFEKEDSRGDVMFRNLDKDGTQRLPGQYRSPKEPLRPPGKEPLRQPGLRPGGKEEEVEEDSKDTPRLQREEPKEGAHISSELNLKKMFEPRQESDSLTPRFNKSDLTLQHLLSGGMSPEVRREQQVRSQEFRSFLDNRGGAAPLAGPSDPINFGSDFTRQPINPTTPQLPQPIGGGVAGSANRFGSPSPAPRPGSPMAGGLPTAFAGAPAPAGFSAGPLLAPKTEPVRPAKQMTFDPPRRKF